MAGVIEEHVLDPAIGGVVFWVAVPSVPVLHPVSDPGKVKGLSLREIGSHCESVLISLEELNVHSHGGVSIGLGQRTFFEPVAIGLPHQVKFRQAAWKPELRVTLMGYS